MSDESFEIQLYGIGVTIKNENETLKIERKGEAVVVEEVKKFVAKTKDSTESRQQKPRLGTKRNHRPK